MLLPASGDRLPFPQDSRPVAFLPAQRLLFTLKALRMAVAQTGRDNPEGLVHHSDRGIQYCCDLYVGEFQKYHIGMMEDYLPTDNAVAERVNGTIKTERVYVRPQRFRDRQDAERQIVEFIDFYNNRRPHMSVGMQTPETGSVANQWGIKFFKIKVYCEL